MSPLLNGHGPHGPKPEVGNPATMPIAIIGMSCKFPGDATDVHKLWDMLAEGRNAWTEIPADRFNKDAFYHPQDNRTGTCPTKGGHFLTEDIATWDASFFNFTGEAARALDPQFRLQLESTYEAIESAGLSMEGLAGTDTSVFAGAFFHDYRDSFMKDTETIPRQVLIGNGSAMASNRISHFFDLRGSSITIDTGCSTALAALHLAVQSIRTGESNMSIVGGSNVIINPDMWISLSNISLLGKTGKCFSFDHRAEGYGRGEGVATIILKPLVDAIRDGDPIRAVIRETAVNQDGKTPTITSPSQEAQESLIRTCYKNAGLDPAQTTYVEAHGTGTKVGDKIETGAVGAVFGPGRSEPVLIGSIKSNIGHLESTSGLAAIIKVALAFEKELIPPSINLEKPNPAIDFEGLNLKIATGLQQWPAQALRRASVSNFGYGGTNTHVILEDPTYLVQEYRERLRNGHVEEPRAKTNGAKLRAGSERPMIFTLSAKEEGVCQTRTEQLRDYLKSDDKQEYLEEIAYTLGQKRSHFPWVQAVSARTAEELLEKLSDSSLKPSNASSAPRLGFVFNGQGAQWHAMGRELISAYPAFAASLHEADDHLKSLGAKWSLVQELTKDEKSTLVNQPEMSFPLCVALQVCLVGLLESWGIKPSSVTGHSSGEISAAFAAGAIDMREALAIAHIRGVLTQELIDTSTKRGKMMAVGLGAEDVAPFVDSLGPHKPVVIACHNSPASVTLSGDADAIDAIKVKFDEQKIFARALKVEAAYHSHHMVPIAERYQRALSQVLDRDNVRTFAEGITFSSPVTGEILDDAEELGAAHWVHNMVHPVLFAQSLHDMIMPAGSKKRSVDFLVEIGPHGALAGPIRQTMGLKEFKGLNIGYGSCLNRGTDAIDTAQNLACLLLSKGYPVDLKAINFPYGSRDLSVMHDLPAYPWNHSVRYWEEPVCNAQLRNRKFPPHDLLGVLSKDSNTMAPSWRNVIRPADLPWVADHCLQSKMVYPAAGCLAMVIEAMRQLHTSEEPIVEYWFRDVEMLRAIMINESIDLQLCLTDGGEDALDASNWKEFHIYSATAENGWHEHSKGFVTTRTKPSTEEAPSWSPNEFEASLWTQGGARSQSFVRHTHPSDFFDHLHSFGVEHGPKFQNLIDIVSRGRESLATFEIADTRAMMPHNYQEEHIIHPTTLDSVFQLAYAPLRRSQRTEVGTAVPRMFKSIRISADIPNDVGHQFKNYTELTKLDSQGFEVNLAVAAADRPDVPVIEVASASYQSMSHELDLATEESDSRLSLKTEWDIDLALLPSSKLKEMLAFPPNPAETVMLMDMRRVIYLHIHAALEELTDADVKDMEPHHKALYGWMKLQEEKASLDQLGPKSSKWARISEGVKDMLFDKVSAASINGRAVSVIGENLVDILRKEEDPAALLAKDQLLKTLREQSLRSNRSLAQIASITRLFAHKNPRANVLEIGAGTGTCTSAVLQALGGGDTDFNARFDQYTFTDSSEHYFEDAKAKFASWGDLVKYKKLNIGEELEDFEAESYDLIVSFQCLTATTDLRRAMTNVRKLLKPGGTLMLVEPTRDSMDSQLVFGTLPNWWSSVETERKQSPNASVEMWQKVLEETGFTGIDFEVRDSEDAENYSFSLITSTTSETSGLNYPEVTIVYTEQPPKAWLEAMSSSLTNLTGRSPAVAHLSDVKAEQFCIFVGEAKGSALKSIDAVTFEALKDLASSCEGLLWVSRGGAIECVNPFAAMQNGFLRSLQLEHSGKSMVALDLDPRGEAWALQDSKYISDVFRSVVKTWADDFRDQDYALREGVLLVPRAHDDMEYERITGEVAELHPFVGRDLRLEVGTEGLLDSLRFVEAPELSAVPLDSDSIEIQPKAIGLNFRDVMVAMGQMHPKYMGFECSGILTRVGSEAEKQGYKVGDRVMALTSGNAWASSVRVPWTHAARLSDTMGFEEAASMPTVWVTVHHALIDIARIRAGEKILIHAATGGVGQAAVMLAQFLGAEVFCTVGSAEKRDFVAQTYGVPNDHIFSSRDASFATNVLASTNGRGVDVVLNSLAGPLLEAGWKCIAPLGRFIEIGKRDIQANKSLPMECFQKAVTFAAVDIMQLARYQGAVVFETLRDVLRLVDKGSIKAVHPVTVYPISEMQSAFRTMQAGKHRGKIVIVPKPGDRVPVMPKKRNAQLDPNFTYVLVGGIAGLGQSVAEWALAKGAKNLVIMSRSIASKKDANGFASLVRADGCNIKLCNCDITDKDSLAKAFREIKKEMPPIRGIINGAMVLNDTIFETMNLKQWEETVRPKVQGTVNLHTVLTEQAIELDFFIFLSSCVGAIGNAAQTNYGAANAFQGAFARLQRSRGLPYVALDLGYVREIGIAARTKGVEENMRRQGHRALYEDDVLDILDYTLGRLLTDDEPTAPASSRWTTPTCSNTEPWQEPINQILLRPLDFLAVDSIWWRRDARFQSLKRRLNSSGGGGGGSGKKSKGGDGEFAEALKDCASVGDAVKAIALALAGKLAEMFMKPADEFGSDQPMSKFGVDSLVAVELRNWLGSAARADVNLLDVLQSQSLIALAEIVASKSRLVLEAGFDMGAVVVK